MNRIVRCCLRLMVLSNIVFGLIIVFIMSPREDREKYVIHSQYNNLTLLRDVPADHNFHIKHFVVLGYLQPMREVLLNIGIVSVYRPGDMSYLHATLQSVLAVSSYERDKLRVMLLLPNPKPRLLQLLKDKFSRQLEKGLLLVLGPIPDGYYPSLHDLPPSYNDPPERITWRAKQNLDYTFLWRMALQTKAQYYLQLEDDVVCTENYFHKLTSLVNERKNNASWALMEFSPFGFIGKLFKMEDLNKMASLAYHFYAEQPVDYLMMIFRQIMNQKEPIKFPSLFKHIGFKSSLKGKFQPVRDEFFEAKDLTADNPPATLETSMISEQFPLVNAYNRQPVFFWYDRPKAGDWILIKFAEAQNIEKLEMASGNIAHPNDILQHARVTYSKSGQNTTDCGYFLYDGVFSKGAYYMGNKLGLICVKIRIFAPQDTWFLLRDIAVHLKRP